MTESTPPEGQQPLTQAQIRQLRRDLREQVLDRALSDPDFKGQLLDDPELAMREANFPAAQQLRQQGASQVAEVTGQFYGNRWRPHRSGYGGPFGTAYGWCRLGYTGYTFFR
jgi:hypothetical protein